MNIVIGSAWRSSEHNVSRYLDQVFALQALLEPYDHNVRVIGVEGDSVDGTLQALQRGAEKRLIDLQVKKFDQHTPHWGSTTDPRRMKALSEIANTIFDMVDEDDDIFVYVESDLIWEPEPIATLIQMVEEKAEGYDIIAPLVFAGEHFYDVWAFRKNGEQFGPFPPYHSKLREGLTEVDSVGSCMVMHTEVAYVTRIKDDNAFVGWCKEARAQGYRIAAHSNLRVNHPC